MLFRLETGTKILNPLKIQIIIIILLLTIGIILLSNSRILSKKIFPILDKFFLLPFPLVIFLLVLLKPTHMENSLLNLFSNLLTFDYWGLAFWLVIIILISKAFATRLPIETFLINIIVSSTSIIITLVFLRNPYRLGWTDSANRLMTIGLPIGIMLLAVTMSKWVITLGCNTDVDKDRV
ncbi:MAG: hypothetical protein EHM20_08175 [Alphaproteobacteria bacterium]|nr:MAG: hypothetical protein EHM20_08175 [Alphaproteobacteria bacterium]